MVMVLSLSIRFQIYTLLLESSFMFLLCSGKSIEWMAGFLSYAYGVWSIFWVSAKNIYIYVILFLLKDSAVNLSPTVSSNM